MKTQIICGPAEFSITYTREENDGLAWDMMVNSMEKFAKANQQLCDEQTYRLLRDFFP